MISEGKENLKTRKELSMKHRFKVYQQLGEYPDHRDECIMDVLNTYSEILAKVSHLNSVYPDFKFYFIRVSTTFLTDYFKGDDKK